MKKVLIIAYYFPPLGMGGVQRILKFCKYLPEFGWKPIVLTVEKIGYFAEDPTLLEEVRGKTEIYRTIDPLGFFPRSNSPFLSPFTKGGRGISSWFLFPDSKIGWLPFAFSKGLKITEMEGVDLLFSSAPPYTSLLVGILLKKRTGLPLVLDFRDPWFESFFFKPPTLFHRKSHEILERRVLASADWIVSVNEPVRELFLKKIPQTLKERVSVIPHGYDAEDFDLIHQSQVQAPNHEIASSPSPRLGYGGFAMTDEETNLSSPFTIVHVGALNEWARPDPLLLAVHDLLQEKKIKGSDLKVVFVGHSSERDWNLSEGLGLEGCVQFVPYEPHRKSLESLLQADLLWLTITGESKGGEEFRSPGKLYEYLGSRKPIIASVPLEGIAARMITEMEAGIAVEPQDVEGLKRAILDFFLKKRRGELRDIPLERVQVYERKRLAERLSKIFDEVV